MKEAEEAMKFSLGNVQHNLRVVAYFRNFMAILVGCISGILGLTGLYGIAGFFLSFVLGSVMLQLKSKGAMKEHYPVPSDILRGGILTGLLSYILFWTLLYNVFHVY
uniref:ER membrane protein complex subunit 6 n=1 Tax=Palpitomonas bilix TaxID=652834 RepID=A0A7S3GM48_9EUKA|mmetsp:Transcript_917/g.1868  ORF Transcript_917/g.1868 Transcript_917/m.1868 type:complete len:107 (+) Transcript_917:88-408(+)